MSSAAAVQTYFEKRAVQFDRLYEPRGLAHTVNRVFRKGLFVRTAVALEECARVPGRRVLDVGCGSGRNSVLFLREGKAAEVVGVDFSAPMVGLARRLVQSFGCERQCRIIQGDFMKLSFPQKFDLAVALGVFDYLDDPVSFLKKMILCCRSLVLFSAPGYSWMRMPLHKLRYMLKNCPVYFYSRKRLADICDSAGLEQFEIRPIASSGFVVIGRRVAG